MADAQRWSVTYTKHLKQKRKLYQDGFLELQSSTNKLLLYDACDKLLECRILKSGEIVSCGETLTFNAFLVDVSDSEGPPTSVSEKTKSRKLNLSPSHQIIRDFKKREILKYTVMQTKSPDAAKSSVSEWEAMYTTQLTQKAKKFHDGFLQLSVRGSTGRHVTLYDASRNSVARSFLKKDDKIASGVTITFDGHLVEIGETRENLENKCNVVKEKGTMQRQDNCAFRNPLLKESTKTQVQKNRESCSSQETKEDEWRVLYTTQLTQKSKKYHDGFLQLAICGSRGREAKLYDESKTILHRGFLKKEEVIRTGISLKFDAYLIDVGDREGMSEINSANKEKVNIQQDSLTPSNYNIKGKSLTNSGLRMNSNANTSIFKQVVNGPIRTDQAIKPLHDESIKIEDQKDKTSRSCQETKEVTATDWQVLYTTQLTQKSKKYHDGFLRIETCGTREKEAKLYDDSKTILHRGFLKKEEVIEAGRSLKFDAYLIDIGYPEGKSGIDLTTTEIDSKSDKKEIARKKMILHGGFLKNKEVIETDISLKLDANLIDIKNPDGNSGIDSTVTESNSEMVNKEKANILQNLRTSNNYIIEGKSLATSGLRIYANSKVSTPKQETKGPTGTDPANKPLRDARQILSILQKPKPGHSPAFDYMTSSNAEVADLDFSKNDQLLMSEHEEANKTADMAESRENEDLERSAPTLSSTEMLNGNGSQLLMDTDSENLNQKLSSELEAANKCGDGENCMDFPFITAPCGVFDDSVNRSQASKAPPEFPSFDLGFF